MTKEDLSQDMKLIYDVLDEDGRQKLLSEVEKMRISILKGAVCTIMARNNSHKLEKIVLKLLK